jgi:glycosyltransferase (activator-dependent family)
MRILFASIAEKTHFLGMVPLAWALQTAGHEVRVASQPEMTDVITGAGLTAVPVGRNHRLYLLSKVENTVSPGKPLFDMSDERPEQLRWDRVRPGYEQLVQWWWRVVNDPMVDGLTEYCRQWRPDLVIWEPITYAAPVAARASGAAHARFMWGFDVFGRMREQFRRLRDEQPPQKRTDPFAEWLGGRAERHGVEFAEEMVTGQFTIDYHPESVRIDGGGHHVPIRYVPYNGVSVIPPWLRVPPERPRVCLTLGTAAAERLGGYEVPVAELLDALGGEDIEVVATVSEREQARLGSVPDNVRLVSFVPLHALVPTCSVVIHHGGGGSYCTPMLNGVPQLILPKLFDAPLRARSLTEYGAGLTIDSDAATGANVREHVLRLLGEESFRQRASQLREEVLAMPTPNELVPELERLTAKYRPGPGQPG